MQSETDWTWAGILLAFLAIGLAFLVLVASTPTPAG